MTVFYLYVEYSEQMQAPLDLHVVQSTNNFMSFEHMDTMSKIINFRFLNSCLKPGNKTLKKNKTPYYMKNVFFTDTDPLDWP